MECIYSIINKNKSENSDRNLFDVNRSLSSILEVKLYRLESDHKCYDFHPDKKLIKDAKQATQKYNELQWPLKWLGFLSFSKQLDTFIAKIYCCCQKTLFPFSVLVESKERLFHWFTLNFPNRNSFWQKLKYGNYLSENAGYKDGGTRNVMLWRHKMKSVKVLYIVHYLSYRVD